MSIVYSVHVSMNFCLYFVNKNTTYLSVYNNGQIHLFVQIGTVQLQPNRRQKEGFLEAFLPNPKKLPRAVSVLQTELLAMTSSNTSELVLLFRPNVNLEDTISIDVPSALKYFHSNDCRSMAECDWTFTLMAETPSSLFLSYFNFL